MSDLSDIAQAFAAHPDIASVRRTDRSELIAESGWMIWLRGSWLADHAGTGPTLEEAYQDAKNRMAIVNGEMA